MDIEISVFVRICYNVVYSLLDDGSQLGAVLLLKKVCYTLYPFSHVRVPEDVGLIGHAGFPVELAAFHDHAADGRAVAADELGGGMDHDVRAVLDGPDQVGSAEGIVFKRKVFDVSFAEMMNDDKIEKSVDNLFAIYSKHLKIAVDATGRGIMHHLKYQTKSQPELILNLFQHGLIEKGVNITDGGANYYNMCVDGSGIAVAADALMPHFPVSV